MTVPNFWNKDKTNKDSYLPVKVQFKGLEQPVIFLMKHNMKLNKLSHKISTGECTKYQLNKKSYELYMLLPVGILLTKLANEMQLQGHSIHDILECSAIHKAEDIKEGGNSKGYEGFITHKTPGSPKSKVTFFVTKSKSGHFIFTILSTSYTIINT